MRRSFLALALGLVLTPAFAATSPVKLTGKATASVANSCVIVSADSLLFGAYSPISGLAANTSGQVRATCTKGTVFTVAPTSGGNTLTGAGGSLSYQLYTTASLSQGWGKPTTTAQTLENTTNAISYWGTSLTEAQFLANPAYAKQPYFYTRNINGTSYLVDYQGQGSGTRAGVSNITLKTSTYSVPIIAHTDNPGALPKSTGNSNYDSALYVILPADTNSYSKTGNVYTVQVPSGNNATLGGTAASSKTPVAVTYYGQVPASQDVKPGTYTDTVVFTVSF